MPKLTFWGESDDIVLTGVNGRVQEEYGAIDGAEFSLTCGHESMTVFLRYGDGKLGGVWGAGIAPADEDYPLPEWPVSVRLGGRNYSTELCIEAPEGTSVVWLNAR